MKNKQPAAQNPIHFPAQGAEARAFDHLKAGRLNEAATLFREVVSDDPQHWRGLHLLGLIAMKQNQHAEAAQLISQALHVKPDLAEAYSDLAVVFKEMGRFDEAREACDKAILLKPTFHPAYSNLGNILKAQGKLDEAAVAYRKSVAIEPGFADGQINLANVLVMMKRNDEALVAAQKAVKDAPLHAEAHIVLGHALRQLGKTEEAMAAFLHALELRPEYGPVYSDLGVLLDEQGQHEEAVQAHQRALQFSPNYAEAHNNLGIALRSMGRYLEAIQNYKHAIALKPDYAEAYSNMGAAFDLLGRHGEAVDAYRRAAALQPDLTIAYVNLGSSLWEQGKLSDAIAAYSYALSLDPDQASSVVDLYNLRRHACDWRDLRTQEEKISTSTYRKGKAVAPFPILAIHGDPAEEQLCARAWAKRLTNTSHQPFQHIPLPSASNPRKLRIGYLSADFCRHATAALITQLIEIHDRDRFEVFGYSYGKDDKSEMRGRLIAAFDTFVDIHSLPHPEAARRIHGDEIDILIDLKGYTTYARTEILAHRPAPIQVNYLGFPGTMGAPFIDYLIADPFVVPMESHGFYDEKIATLPNCYQPNDTKRRIAADVPTRTECGLPEQGFVFCCFNNSYKITPDIFDIWMRLLAGVQGSVLWLLEANPLVQDNLRREASARSINPDRIVFAPKQDLSQHLARHAQADLFLDTLPYNAHTTTSDALWTGLPVVTCAGKSFASRVAGSLLRSVGLPELITTSLVEYEATALRLARSPGELLNLHERLVKNLQTAPLFDTERYAQDLEAAFEHMASIGAAGGAPRSFAVAELDRRRKYDIPLSAKKPVALKAVKVEPAAAEKRSVLREPRIAYEACPLCDSKEITVVKEGNCSGHPIYQPSLPPIMKWCGCTSCNHVFTEGYFTPEAAAIVFSKTQPSQTVGFEIEQQRAVSARMIERVARYAPAGDWLDIGVGNGSLLFTADEWGYKAVGVDLRTENVNTLIKLGFEAYCEPVETLDFPGRFSVVSMADVLEHIPFPKPALEAAHRLTREGGVLFISMPNMETMIWRALDGQNANPYWGEIEHYHNFTRTRLYALLEEKGFTPLQYGVSERYRGCMEVIAVRR